MNEEEKVYEIDQEFDKETGNEIRKMGIGDLWELFRSCKGNEEFERIKDFVKNGVSVPVQISSIIKKRYKEFPNVGRVMFPTHGFLKEIDLDEEISLRKDLMREVLLEGVGTGRTEAY